MEDRYIMMVDENGQPFICHAGMFQKAGNAIKSAGTAAANAVRNVGRGRGTRQNHKYLMKVGAPEKPRYLYTQEEVRAYLQGGRRALNNAVNKAGQTAKNAVNTAKNTANNAVNKAGQATKNAVNTAKNAANKAVDVVKDKAGVDERKRAEEAWDKVPRRVSSDDKEAVEAFRKATEAQKEYRKTPLGAAEYAKERAYEIATGQDGTAKEIAEKVVGKAKEKATEAVDNVKSKYDRMHDEFQEKKDNVANEAKEVAEGVKAYHKWANDPGVATQQAVKDNKYASKIQQTIRDFTDNLDQAAMKAASGMKGADTWKAFQEANRKAYYDQNLSDADRQKYREKADKLWDEWQGTPHYKFISGNIITDMQSNGVKDTIRERADIVKDKAGNVVDNAKSKYDRMRDDFREKREEKQKEKENRKPWLTYTESGTDSEGNKTSTTYTNREALKPTAKAVGKLVGTVAKAKAEQKVEKLKETGENIADKVDNAVDKVGDAAENVADSVREAKKDAVNYAKKQEAKMKAKKYDKEWAKLDQEAQRLRKENGGNDSYAVLIAEARAKSKRVDVLREKQKADPHNDGTKAAFDRAFKESKELWDKVDKWEKNK